jgi:hypothetical protein
MYFTKKNLVFIAALNLFLSTTAIKCMDFITIESPEDSYYGTVGGSGITVSGTSSQPNFSVRGYINGNDMGYAITDAYGNWNFFIPGSLNNGTYTVIVNLVNSWYSTLATASVTFTVDNGNSIQIYSPTEGQTISFDPVNLSGASTLPNSTVNILLDGNQIATTTTDGNGNFQISYTVTAANGVHTFLAQLMAGDNVTVLAEGIVDVVSNIPFVFPSGTSQVRFMDGTIPTSGSGSGQGYTYTVSGSTMTINFVPAFNTTPSLVATGLKSSGSSTVSLTSVTTTAASIAFSTGTQKVHFSASALQ